MGALTGVSATGSGAEGAGGISCANEEAVAPNARKIAESRIPVEFRESMGITSRV
jgi:hypothetical protein